MSPSACSFWLKNNGSVGLVSVSLNFSIRGVDIWAAGMYIPFGHSFWAFFGHVFEQMLIIWGVGFLGDEGTTPRPAPRVAWARKLWFSPKRVLRRSAVRFISSGTR